MKRIVQRNKSVRRRLLTAHASQWKASQSAEDILLLKQMKEQRDSEVHKEGADVSHQVEDVPVNKI